MAFAPFDLTGHVALVTGGNSGIGLGMAEGLAMAGADVAVWGTNEAKNADAARRLETYDGRVVALRCNVGDEAEVDAAFAATVEALGKVDSCFANAGVGGNPTRVQEFPTEEWRRVLGINLDGAFYTLRVAAGHLVERGEGGSLIATSSLAAVHGAAGNVAYGATKGALVALVRAMAVELGPRGIRVNAVLPGWVDTPMTESAMESERFQQAVLRRVPARRPGRPEDFGGIAVYLASAASAYHSGDSILIDGAYSLF